MQPGVWQIFYSVPKNLLKSAVASLPNFIAINMAERDINTNGNGKDQASSSEDTSSGTGRAAMKRNNSLDSHGFPVVPRRKTFSETLGRHHESVDHTGDEVSTK